MKLINLFDYEQAAQAKMRASFFGYYAGGAGDEITLRENRTVFDSIKLRPKVLIDVSHRTLETTILGHPTALPMVIAPMAMAKLAHRKGEVAIARAAKKAGIIHCLSTLSSTSLETVASVGAANWFQLYIYKERGITTRLIERAAVAGYKALVLTVDTAVVGVRENLLRTGFRPPLGVKAENFTEFYGAKAALRLPARFNPTDFDSSLTWDDLKWLIASSSLPVLVKGILRGDDAKRAIDCGAAGIIVSNHGGRQLDTAVVGIKALPEVVAAVGAQTEVLVDGGIRRGTDIVKALALGARAVLVGRPVLWGLAVSAQKGVEQIFDVLKRELDIAMALCGCSSVAEIGSDLITE